MRCMVGHGPRPAGIPISALARVQERHQEELPQRERRREAARAQGRAAVASIPGRGRAGRREGCGNSRGRVEVACLNVRVAGALLALLQKRFSCHVGENGLELRGTALCIFASHHRLDGQGSRQMHGHDVLALQMRVEEDSE